MFGVGDGVGSCRCVCLDVQMVAREIVGVGRRKSETSAEPAAQTEAEKEEERRKGKKREITRTTPIKLKTHLADR